MQAWMILVFLQTLELLARRVLNLLGQMVVMVPETRIRLVIQLAISGNLEGTIPSFPPCDRGSHRPPFQKVPGVATGR